MIPKALQRGADALRGRGFSLVFFEDGPSIYLLFNDFPLPSGRYNLERTDLLILTSVHYPCAGFDMFWTDPRLALSGGAVPKQAECIERYLDREWRRFSYHPYANVPWNPGEDDVERYVEYVQQRLRNGD